MRELLEKAHQQDDDDLFQEEEGDDEFSAPRQLLAVYYRSQLISKRIYEMSIWTNSPIQTTNTTMKKLKSEKSGGRRNER